MDYKKMDERALEIAKKFKACEAELLDIIQKVDKNKVFTYFGFNSVFQYTVHRLKLSEAQACAFISVARKSQEVPELKRKIESGELTISKAKRITSVINKENKESWLHLAMTQSQKKVEREVALASPKTAIHEKSTYIPADEKLKEKAIYKKELARIKLELGLSEELMLKFRKAQDLVSQKKRESVSLETTLEVLVNLYLEKNDPLKKAERQKVKGKLSVNLHSSRNTKGKAGEETINDAEQSLRKVNSRAGASGAKIMEKEQTTRRVSQSESDNIPKAVGRSKQIEQPRGKEKQRKPLPALLKHQVYLKDQGKCSYKDERGKICSSRRFLEIHHIKPISLGGADSLENLALLCHGHHKATHFKSW